MADILGYHMPDELYYHPDHTWARVDDDGMVVVGLDDFLRQMAGGIHYIELPELGEELMQGEACGMVECQKWVGALAAPIAGTVAEVNTAAELEPGIVNEDCYDNGWLFVLAPGDLAADLSVLFHGEAQLDAWLAAELDRLDEDEE
jgi:glycine cleavage system H protein